MKCLALNAYKTEHTKDDLFYLTKRKNSVACSFLHRSQNFRKRDEVIFQAVAENLFLFYFRGKYRASNVICW